LIFEETGKENEESIDPDLDQNVERNTESTLAVSQKSSVILRKRKATMEDRRFDKTFKILKTNSRTIQDNYQYFGNLIAAKLRKFSEYVRTNLENIMGLFLKASRGFYNSLSTCNCFLREQMSTTHQTSNSRSETSSVFSV